MIKIIKKTELKPTDIVVCKPYGNYIIVKK